MAWTPLFVGIVLGAAGMVAMVAGGIVRERGPYVVIIVAIAAFYPVFAVGREWETFTFHSVVALLFLALSLLGARTSLWWVVGAMAMHGVFDFFDGIGAPDPSPDWWGPFCLGVDVTIAAALAWLLHRGAVPVRSVAENGQANSRKETFE